MEEARAAILVVDDEESVRDIVSRKLKSEGYDCETASDGEEALWKSFMRDFDMMLLDIRMPGLSGMEVLDKMVVDHPDTCVVMITAISDIQTAVDAMKIGAYDYLTKPFNLDDLVVRVDRALERRRLILENRDYQLRLEQKVTRQVGQIQRYHDEALDALSREQKAIAELDEIRGPNDWETVSLTAPRGLLWLLVALVKKLSRLLGGGASDSGDSELIAVDIMADTADSDESRREPS